MSTIKVTNLQDTSGGNQSTSGEIFQGRAKAWINFNGQGTPTIRDDYNVSSLTDNGTGLFSINFTSPFSSSDYAAIGMSHYGMSQHGNDPYSTSAFKVVTYATPNGGNADYVYNDIAFFGV